jgi:hypothetical protein
LAILLGVLFSGCAKLNPKFEDSLNNALNAKKGEFQTCYERALKRNRNLKGEMDLKLAFTPNAKKVDKAKVTRSQIKDKGMKKCVSKAAKRIQTTELPGTWVDGKYTIDFTLNQ